MSFDTNLKRIDWRNWDEIKVNWLMSLPIIDPPGQSPIYQISEIPNLLEIVKKAKSTGEYKDEFYPLREAVLREAIYLFHKALGVSAVSEFNIKIGFNTWAMSNSYHSAFYSIKSILGFLGITLPRIENVDYLIDLFPEKEKLSRNQIQSGRKPEPIMKFIRFQSLKHYEIWRIFQRTIKVLHINLWDESIIYFLNKLHPLQFAKQRNSLHYINNFWIYPDLFEPKINESVCYINNLLDEFEEGEFLNREDFSLILSLILIGLAYSLFFDLSKNTPIIKTEFELINSNMQKDFHSTLNYFINNHMSRP